MPTKITRSSRYAPKPPHKPVFPVRKPALVKASDEALAPINAGKVKAHYVSAAGYHGVIWLQYVAFGALLLTALVAGFYAHRTLALAEVGAVTCSAENSYMWTMPTPDSDVPVLNDNVMRACAKAYNPLG
jgi:hypothetical protein